MAKGLSAAQRRAVTGSDPATGRLSARADVCAGLAARGLAVPHGRAGHHSFYLSPEGLRLRAELAAAPTPDGDEPAKAAEVPPGGGFVADLGTADAPRPGDGVRRRAEVAVAWEGLLQIRALLLDGATDVPAPWERERRAHAVALALEAAGCPPGGPDRAGYTVAEAAAQAGVIEVGWRGPAAPADQARALAECARLLESHGWQSTRHTDRSGRAFLLASPRHA
ncbi:hypothetical protein [Streptomyces sp. CA-111067]|uniref:hypothetical protein n=1 Tax=Streptomyces sp. CA-111067 TaxID=3240046 RepID=UPI003D96DD35